MNELDNYYFNLRFNYHYIKWIKENLRKVLTTIKGSYVTYAVGGNLAALLQGVNFNRESHDIDVVVNSEEYQELMKAAEKNPLVEIVVGSSDIPNQHFGIKIATLSCTIDIICNDNMSIHMVEGIWVSSIKDLYETKKRYNRPKDREDLKKLQPLYEMLYNA